MNLPRPLLIVVVVIVLLAVFSCGLTAAGPFEPDPTEEPPLSQIRDGGFANFFRLLEPPSARVRPQDIEFSPCAADDKGDLNFIGNCTLTVAPSSELRRELTLDVSDGVMVMRVSGVSSGRSYDSESHSVDVDSDEGSVVLGRDDRATVSLTCPVACVVHVGHEPGVHP